jgi:hypothetical protein
MFSPKLVHTNGVDLSNTLFLEVRQPIEYLFYSEVQYALVGCGNDMDDIYVVDTLRFAPLGTKVAVLLKLFFYETKSLTLLHSLYSKRNIKGTALRDRFQKC